VNRLSQKAAIHQFHFYASPADAVTNHMLFVQKALREVGIGGDIFANEIKDGLGNTVRPLSDSDLWNCDCLLIHHSQGNPGLKSLLGIEVPKALIYHNITPAHFFSYDPYVAQLNELGRAQLELLQEMTIASFTFSKFSARDLASPSTLLPLFDLDSLLPGWKVKTKVKTRKAPEFLFVGRLVPHKNPALLIEMMYYYVTRINPDATLILAGKPDPIYGRYLRLLTLSLGLKENVIFTGQVSAKTLSQLYSRADAFVCASEHEGYCIPLVEAMKAGIPVFAVDSPGIEETLGGAGVLFRTRNPGEMAETLGTFGDDSIRWRAIVKSQTSRLSEIGKTCNRQNLQKEFLRLVKNLRSSPEVKRELNTVSTPMLKKSPKPWQEVHF
jgi:glycosyltransferase involved in cell wall biosynthesis